MVDARVDKGVKEVQKRGERDMARHLAQMSRDRVMGRCATIIVRGVHLRMKWWGQHLG